MAQSPMCERCSLPHPPLVECIQAQADQMKKLLILVGDVGRCGKCGATVFWVRHLSGAKAPYTQAGLIHFVDCPFSEEIRKERAQ